MICFCRNTWYAGLQTFPNWTIVMEFGIDSTRCLVIEYKENINFDEQLRWNHFFFLLIMRIGLKFPSGKVNDVGSDLCSSSWNFRLFLLICSLFIR